MIKDMKTDAEEDRKFEELAKARNEADALISTQTKLLKIFGKQSN
ncbi:hypothetical protein ABVN80_19185 [Acinetobacter baumannii]